MARYMGQATQDRLARMVPGASAVLDVAVQAKMQKSLCVIPHFVRRLRVAQKRNAAVTFVLHASARELAVHSPRIMLSDQLKART